MFLKMASLNISPDLHYECIRCGRSCGEFWEIPVTEEKAAEIRARPKEELRAAGDPGEPIVESPWTPGQLVMRMREETCTMLTDKGLCSLHAAFGPESKPNICRSFPYRFIETPRGDTVGVSFACTAVLGSLGPAISTQRQQLEELQAFTLSRRRIEGPPGLTGFIPTDWEQYEAIEEDLTALLDPALGPLGQRLVSQSVYLQLLVKFLREARREADAELEGPEANEEPLAVFRRRMRGDESGPWPLVRALAAKRGPSPLLRRMILGFAHALRNTYGERRGRLRSYVMVIATYIAAAAGRGGIELPKLKHSTPYRRIGQIGFDPGREALDELLTRYFRHRLFRKDLLLADTIQFGHHLLLLHWGLIHWYSAVFADNAGADQIELEHLTEGLRNVEKFYVYHSTLDNLFAKYPLLRGFLDRLFDHPLYAFSMGYAR